MEKIWTMGIAVRSLECHRRFQHEAHHHFSWLDMIWMTSQESGFSENIWTASHWPFKMVSLYLFCFASMLKSILIIVEIISIPLQTESALKSRKNVQFWDALFALYVSKALFSEYFSHSFYCIINFLIFIALHIRYK